ncbi:MAG: cyclic pyranopterin monophosphate synthase MoaC [Flavobacteriales bacterium]|nr:cyclic pyranopterin monophosphate synthase MoaC [Flavobacteriales bacterium]
MSEFTHLNDDHQVSMVDVSEKAATKRRAVAQVKVILPEAVASKLVADGLQTPKGPVFEVARIAGIMAAKRTGELIPLCHPIGVEHVDVQISMDQQIVKIICTATVFAKTGIEMEALTGASVAALTIYDMCKALSHEIIISDLQLIEKTGGKSDYIKKT